MKDASSCKISLKGLSIAIGQVPESTIGDVIVRGVPSNEIKIDELILESNLDYQFDEGELKDTNNAVVDVFKQITNLSVMILNSMVADKRAEREATMTRENKRHENEMAKLRLIDELDDLKNKRIHERERYNASKI